MKRPPLYIVPFVVVLVIVVLLQAGAPQPIDWTPSFVRTGKMPYGAYILFELLPELFPKAEVEIAHAPAYVALGDRFDSSEAYIVVNNRFGADEYDTQVLLNYVERGNTVFIAADDFGRAFADTLGFATSTNYMPFGDSTGINLVSPSLRDSASYRFKEHTVDGYFSRFDTAHSVVLGEDNQHRPNFLMMRFGKGTILVSSVPLAFTNYNLLAGRNAEYVYKALSYVSAGRRAGRIVWDEHYKAGRQDVETPMRYVLSLEPLRWAFYLTLAGVALFMIFMGKRRQRVIPVVRPLPNTTLEFTNTVSQLYLQHGDHRNIAEKKIIYFLEYLRSSFNVNTNGRSEDLYRMIAARSGVEADQVRAAFAYIDKVRASDRLDADELQALNTAVEKFYNRS